MTDGRPGDEGTSDLCPFGFRDATEKVLRQLAYPPERGKWYLAKNTSVEQALAGILDIIMKTVVASARTATSGQPALTQQAPANGSGIVQGNSSYDPDYVATSDEPHVVTRSAGGCVTVCHRRSWAHRAGVAGWAAWHPDRAGGRGAECGDRARHGPSRGQRPWAAAPIQRDSRPRRLRTGRAHRDEPDAPRAVAVVCDGVGSLGRSHEAARLVSRMLAGAGRNVVPWPKAFAQANEDVRALLAQTPSCPGDDADLNGMATTALAASVHRVADTWMLTSAWVGDSSLWHLSAAGEWSLLAGAVPEDDDAFHSSGVRPLPSPDGACAEDEFSVSGGAIFLMSDGVANPLKWSREVRETLAGWWARPPDPFTFAAQVSFARRSHIDDRTVVGIWPDSGVESQTGSQRPGDDAAGAGRCGQFHPRRAPGQP